MWVLTNTMPAPSFPRLPFLLFVASSLTTTTQSIAPRMANECVYTAGQNNFIVRDSQSTRFLLLDDTIVSSCFCWERETGQGVLPASSTLGIMATSQGHPTAGVIGVGHGTSPLSTCRMKTCVVDPVHLPKLADRKIMQTLSDLLHNAARLESPTPHHRIHSDLIEAKMYMIGGGGGTLGIALLTAFPKVTLDVAEREPTIVTLARSHFGFTSSLDGRLSVYNSDGREFLVGTRGYYDVIIIDAIPNHRMAMDAGTPNRFVTYQFLQTAVTSLHRDNGVVLSNCYHDAIGDVLKTFVELFGDGRVWYMLVQPPHHYLVLGFHFNMVTTVEESVQMSKDVLGDHLHFNRPESGVLDRKGAQVLCDPGQAGCVV